MGKKDTVTKEFMRRPDVFADAFNLALFEGSPVIQPERLHPLDSVETAVPYGEKGAGLPVQKQRDVLKYWSAMEDDSAVYVILGIENQSALQYAMPVKAMVYDALQYAAQVEEAARSHREKGKDGTAYGSDETASLSGEAGSRSRETAYVPTGAEYLSGFYKTDRLVPVITLVVSFAPQEWDAPTSLHDLFLPALRDTRILSFVPDYRINLLSPASMQGDELERLKTDLRTVFLFIRYSQDREQLQRIIENDSRFHMLDRTAAEVINATTGAKIALNGKGAKVDMCKAIQEMREIEFAQGHSLGMEQGVQEGRQQGIQQGLQEGIRAFIQNYREENLPMERLAAKLQKFFSLSEEEAKLSIEKYS